MKWIDRHDRYIDKVYMYVCCKYVCIDKVCMYVCMYVCTYVCMYESIIPFKWGILIAVLCWASSTTASSM